MELICTTCDGLGEERWPKDRMQPWSNVAGWHTKLDLSYYFRRCKGCSGTGYRPSGVSVPIVPLLKSSDQ